MRVDSWMYLPEACLEPQLGLWQNLGRVVLPHCFCVAPSLVLHARLAALEDACEMKTWPLANCLA